MGAPTILLSDQEGGIAGDEGTQFLARAGVNPKLKARGSHAAIVETHHELWRQQFHKIKSQALSEGLNSDFEMLISSTSFAKNAVCCCNGATPYQAVFGRTPVMLTEFDTPGLAEVYDGAFGSASTTDATRDANRLREIAVECMVGGAAGSRMELAARHNTRPAGELKDLIPGDSVDLYRKPPNKELTGWRGPGTVVACDNNSGTATIRWQGRDMIVHFPHLRRHLFYGTPMADNDMTTSTLSRAQLGTGGIATSSRASTFAYPIMISPEVLGEQSDLSYEILRDYLTKRSQQSSSWFELCSWKLVQVDGTLQSLLTTISMS